MHPRLQADGGPDFEPEWLPECLLTEKATVPFFFPQVQGLLSLFSSTLLPAFWSLLGMHRSIQSLGFPCQQCRERQGRGTQGAEDCQEEAKRLSYSLGSGALQFAGVARSPDVVFEIPALNCVLLVPESPPHPHLLVAFCEEQGKTHGSSPQEGKKK